MNDKGSRFEQMLGRLKVGGTLSGAEISAVARELDKPAPSADPYTLLHILGLARAAHTLPMIDRYLSAEGTDPEDGAMLRRLAVQILGTWWGRADYFATLRDRAVADESPLVRSAAALAIGHLGRAHPDVRSSAARALLDGFNRHDDEHPEVVGAFRDGMLELIGVPTAEWPLGDELDPTLLKQIETLATEPI